MWIVSKHNTVTAQYFAVKGCKLTVTSLHEIAGQLNGRVVCCTIARSDRSVRAGNPVALPDLSFY